MPCDITAVRRAGLEPATRCLEGSRSVQTELPAPGSDCTNAEAARWELPGDPRVGLVRLVAAYRGQRCYGHMVAMSP
jgi:hypothetical protein